jgi:hypothetical protein
MDFVSIFPLKIIVPLNYHSYFKEKVKVPERGLKLKLKLKIKMEKVKELKKEIIKKGYTSIQISEYIERFQGKTNSFRC